MSTTPRTAEGALGRRVHVTARLMDFGAAAEAVDLYFETQRLLEHDFETCVRV